MNKAIIFDFDGVIIDSELIRYETYKQLFKEEYSVILPNKNNTIIGRTPRENIIYFLKTLNLKGDIDKLVNKRNKLLLRAFSKKENIIPVRGVLNLLNTLKSSNIQMAIASSAHQKYINNILDYLNLSNFFDVVVSGDMIKLSKPNPEIFIEAAKRLNKKNEDCIVIEDSVNGLIAAKAAHMKVIAVTTSFSSKQLSLADKIIKNFDQISLFDIQNI